MRRTQDKRKGSNNSLRQLSNFACGWSIASHPLHRVGTGLRDGCLAEELCCDVVLLKTLGNISTSPLSSVFGSPPPSPKGIPRTEMMVPRHTLERGETSGGNHDDSSSEEGEGYGMEYANRGLMLQVEDLFRFRHFRAKEIIEWCYVDTHTLEALGIRREYERIATQPFWRAICSWRDATYTPIVREFVATLEVNEEIRDRRFPSIKFKLFNKEYDISSDALGNLLGFYTLADQDQAWYADLVDILRVSSKRISFGGL
nr:uncharacterized protein LOC104900936 [Ipomoea batatas]